MTVRFSSIGASHRRSGNNQLINRGGLSRPILVLAPTSGPILDNSEVTPAWPVAAWCRPWFRGFRVAHGSHPARATKLAGAVTLAARNGERALEVEDADDA